jgi:hypothetical protein
MSPSIFAPLSKFRREKLARKVAEMVSGNLTGMPLADAAAAER